MAESILDHAIRAVRAVIVTDSDGERHCKLCGAYLKNGHRPEACEIADFLLRVDSPLLYAMTNYDKETPP